MMELENSEIASTIKVFQALTESRRIRILKTLEEKDRCVCEFMDILGLSQPAVSYHVNILADAGLIKTRKEGKKVICSIRDKHLLNQLFTAAKLLTI